MKVKLLRDIDIGKKGEIVNTTKKGAKHYIDTGVAKYVKADPQCPDFYPDTTKKRRVKQIKKATPTFNEMIKKLPEKKQEEFGQKLDKIDIDSTEEIKGISLNWIKHNIAKWVWAYYNKGFNLIPIGYKTKVPHKKISKGEIKKWQYKRQPEGLIQEWLDKGLFEGVAILGGKVSNNIVCFDFDDPTDFIILKLSIDQLLKEGAWITETPKERGRYHIVMLDKNEVTITRKARYIDYRANEHYWLVYPSIHPNGKQYNFLNTHDPDKLQLPAQRNTLAIFETWNDVIEKEKKTKEKVGETGKTKKNFDNSPDCLRNAWKMGASPGMRYYVAIAFGSWLQQHDFPEEIAASMVVNWFNTKCDTTGRSIEDIKNAVSTAYTEFTDKDGEIKTYDTGCQFWREKTQFCPYEKKTDCPFKPAALKGKKELLEEYEVFYEDKNGNEKISCPKLAKLIMYGDNRHYIVLKDNQDIYVWNGSFYEPIGQGIIENRVSYYLDDLTCKRYKAEVVDFIRHYQYINREELNPPANLINVKNGVLDIETKELTPHTPELYFLREIPINYDPDAKIKKIDQFFNDILNTEDKKIIQEFFGDFLQRTYKYKKSLMVVGKTDTGKSQLLGLMGNFLGEKNTSNVSLYQLCTDKFSTIELYGRYANICADIGATGLKFTELFKMVTGGDRLRGQKKHKDSFEFKNYAKLIYSCNQIPDSTDKSDAYYNRWIVLEFSTQFDKETRNPNILKEISTEEELSGLLNYAIEGLHSLEENNGYSDHRSLEEVKEFMQKGSNPIAEFVTTHVELDASSIITKDNLYSAYVGFCQLFNYPTKDSNVFSRKAKQYFPYGFDEGKKQKKRTWQGLKCTFGDNDKNRNQQILIKGEEQKAEE